MSEAERRGRKRGKLVLDLAERIATLLILVGVVILFVGAQDSADKATRRADRNQVELRATEAKLDLAIAKSDHQGSCFTLYQVYRALRSEITRPPEVASDLPASGGLVFPDPHEIAKALPGCQDVLSVDNLSPPRG